MLTLAHFDELHALLVRAPEPGNLRRPNAVRAFFHRWSRWRAEAAELAATLDRDGGEPLTAAPQSAAAGPGNATRRAPASGDGSRA